MNRGPSDVIRGPWDVIMGPWNVNRGPRNEMMVPVMSDYETT